jgi:iron-sulfur cluster assembly accessory protein
LSETISLTPYKPKGPSASLTDLDGLDCEVLELTDFPVDLTEKAIEMVRSALEETDAEDGEFLRVGVRGGGCAGFQYSLNFTDEIDDDDVATVAGGVKVVTDTFSAGYLKGTELDYVESLQGAGFKFINPNARRTCGCGSSFS